MFEVKQSFKVTEARRLFYESRFIRFFYIYSQSNHKMHFGQFRG